MNRMMNVYKSDIFHITPNFFHVVLFFDEENNAPFKLPNGTLNDRLNRQDDRINDRLNLSESEQSIFDEIQKNPFIKTDELVSLTGFSMPTVNRAIKTLRQKQIIAREGSKKTGHWKIIRENVE